MSVVRSASECRMPFEMIGLTLYKMSLMVHLGQYQGASGAWRASSSVGVMPTHVT